MSKKFQILVADPPWHFGDKLRMSIVKRGAESNYDGTMTTAQIKALPIQDITDPDGAVLCLWVPSSLLQDGLDVMKAWGFTQKQSYIWVKVKMPSSLTKEIVKLTSKYLRETGNQQLDYIRGLVKNKTEKIISIGDNILNIGMGRLFRASHEICLIGINNTKIYKRLENKSQRSVSFAPNLGHSSKPETLQDALDVMFIDPTVNRIELFARRQRPGWICIGNQAPLTQGQDIATSLNDLIQSK